MKKNQKYLPVKKQIEEYCKISQLSRDISKQNKLTNLYINKKFINKVYINYINI